MKRSLRLFLLPILVGSAGCTTVDNNVGSLGADAGPGDGPRKDASGAPAQPADASVADSGACGCVVQAGSPDFVQQPLECRCAKGGCPMTIQDMSSRPECANGKTVLGKKGCGKLETVNNALGGTEFTFDAQTGALLGVYDYDDVPGGTCNVWVYSYGGPRLAADCTPIVSCAVCGPSTAPPCSTVADAGVPDVASVGKDAAQESTSTDAGRVCLYPAGADTSIEAGNGSFVGCRPGSTPDMCDSSSYTMTCQASGLTPVSIPQPASALNCKVLAIPTPSNTLFYCCPCASSPVPDAAVPDAVSVGKDAAPASPEAGAAHQCQVNTDGTCSAVTPNTACTPFKARRYDESASCIATDWTTLWCCATAAGDSCGWPAATGCLQVSTDASVVTYWTPSLGLPPPSIPGMQACDATKSGKVAYASSSLCSAPSPDAAVRSDVAAAIMTPTLPAACTTDADCCVAMDGCMATGYLVGKAEYSSMVASIAKVNSGNRMCVNCLQPAVQVQCKGGFCAGEEILTSTSPASLRTSHCGLVADASGAPAVSPHAPVDAGTSGSSPSAWGCGVN